MSHNYYYKSGKMICSECGMSQLMARHLNSPCVSKNVGRIKLYNSEKGFGFIGTQHRGDFFFHHTELVGDSVPVVGETVSFTPAPPKKAGQKPIATKVHRVKAQENQPRPKPNRRSVPLGNTGQVSTCNRCSQSIEAFKIEDGSAFYHCQCGNRWKGKAFYGKREVDGVEVAAAIGLSTIAGAVVGGPVGAAIGAVLGGIFGSGAKKTSPCMRCGGEGWPTGRDGIKIMYQCKNCKSTWVKRE